MASRIDNITHSMANITSSHRCNPTLFDFKSLSQTELPEVLNTKQTVLS